MDGMLPRLRWVAKQRLWERMRRCRDVGLKGRYLILVNLINGRSVNQTAGAPSVGRSRG